MTLASANPVCFVCTTDRARTKAFYGQTLGLTLVHEDDFALVFDSHGTTLRMSPVKDLTPQPFTVLGWEVRDIQNEVRSLTAAGVVFERFSGLEQDTLAIWSPAPAIFVAWFKDPDGNLLSLSQH